MSDDYTYADLAGLIDPLIDAAIDADMIERGLNKTSEDGKYGDVGYYNVVYRDHPEKNEFTDGSSYEDVDWQAEVFDAWGPKIHQIFDVWMDSLPDPGKFRDAAETMRKLSEEILSRPQLEPAAAIMARDAYDRPPGVLGQDLDKIRTFALDVQRGTWVHAFGNTYARALPNIIGNQYSTYQILANVLDAEADIWTDAGDGLAKIAANGKSNFEALHGGNALKLVIEVAKNMYSVVTTVKGLEPNPVTLVEAYQTLSAIPGDVASDIETYAPPVGGGSGLTSVGQVYTSIAQGVEYTLNHQIRDREQQLSDLLTTLSSSYSNEPHTFAMGAPHLLEVTNPAKIAGEIKLERFAVDGMATRLMDVGAVVQRAADGLASDVFMWLRPPSFGMGETGPFPAFQATENAIRNAAYDTRQNLDDVAGAVRVAARYTYNADDHADRSIRRHDLERVNSALKNYQNHLDDDHAEPPPLVAPPYVPPSGEVYSDQGDCEPVAPDFTIPGQDDPAHPGVDAPTPPLAPSN